ncbi:hypothetical protein P6F26_09760 [Roseibacterium sp. SDUM158017]|uniref:hypothetical protein n=1 Tax=Roseicyclus salinarum TaxID=3036773 RepID=UPI002414F278|nr:hypothetical protein [Roseibacterium sp. SDUM158017]MDG4648731.1 hypothetical protein [Roseibacterium sp. SDUM158017]
MKKLASMFAATLCFLAGSPLAAATFTLEGTRGSGTTLVSASGTSIESGASNALGTIFFQFGDYIAADSIPGRFTELPISGDLAVSFGGQTATLTRLFLDDDGDDDFALLSAIGVNLAGQASFSGSSTLALDISTFNVGTFADGSSQLIVRELSAIPVPASAILLTAAIGLLGALRRRKGTVRGTWLEAGQEAR